MVLMFNSYFQIIFSIFCDVLVAELTNSCLDMFQGLGPPASSFGVLNPYFDVFWWEIQSISISKLKSFIIYPVSEEYWSFIRPLMQ